MSHTLRHMALLGLCLTVLLAAPQALAGDLNPPAAPTDPGSALYTIEDLYKRLDDGTAGSKRVGGFAEPAAGPTAGTGRTLNEVMAKAPAVDDAAGATAAEVTKDKKFWGLRSGGGWGVQTGTLDTGAIPCSGTRWSNTAEDTAGRWCDNGNGTVTDLFGHNGKGKGLVWLKNAGWGEGKAWRVNEVNNHDDAHTRAGLLKSGEAGLADSSVAGDWRLPTLEEFKALTQGTHPILSVTPGPFSGVHWFNYWSSSTFATNTLGAWFMTLGDGNAGIDSKWITNRVWPVRGGQ